MANEPINYNTQEAATKVIKGAAKVDKPPLGKRIVKFLFSDKLDAVGNYLAYYILGPSLKDLVFKLGNGALQMALYGGQGGYGGIGMGAGNYIPGYGYQPVRRDPVPYNNMYQNAPPPPGYANPAPGPVNYGGHVGLTDISFDTRDDAYLVLDRMNRELQRYRRVRVADFYTYAGITGQEGNWTLQSTGWTDLTAARPVMRTDGRWMIEFPPTIAI